MFDVYTDGAYSFSRNQGGSSVVIVKEGQIVLSFNRTNRGGTNNTAELTAIILAMQCFTKTVDKITFYTDSQYCLEVIKNGTNVEVNKELWMKFWAIYSRLKTICQNISFKWIHGHNGDTYNEMADRLAVQASRAL